MTILEFEVYYEHQLSKAAPFRLEDEQVGHNLHFISKDIEYSIHGSRVVKTHEDYRNQRIRIRIEAEQMKDEIVAEVKHALEVAHLSGRQL